MKTIRRGVTVVMVLSALVACSTFLIIASQLQHTFAVDTPIRTLSDRAVPEVGASAAFVIDEQTGVVMFEKNADAVLPIASVTKLFSSALFWGGVEPLLTTTIVGSDVEVEGRSGRLKAGQTYQNRELLFPALLESSNDAAAVMERTAPFDLVAAMNAFSLSAGATQTTFADASGLSDQNVSTARELAMLLRAVKKEYPHIIDVTTLPQYLNHVNAWRNNNPFIDEIGYQGGKHGYTLAANRTAVARFLESTEAGEREVAYVLLGSSDLAADMATLRAFSVGAASLQ